MSMRRPPARTIVAVTLLLSCSCFASPARYTAALATQLPAEVPTNKGAGRGGYLKVKLHLETADEFECILDTGSPGILLPKSLEPKLGKRLGTRSFHTLGGPRERANIYAAPKLYLGKTPLQTGDTIGTWDNSLGVLGMNCLRHYCIQLDFQAGKLRFLDPDGVNPADLGKSFALTSTHYAQIRHPALLEKKTTVLLLDTGFPFDGVINAELFERAIRERTVEPMPLMKDGIVAGTASRIASVPCCVWEHSNYTNLVVQPGSPDLLGLRFLARHKVTFNFPKRTFYLKPTGGDPLPPEFSPQPAVHD